MGSPVADEERLESWKDIAAYLKRDVSTVQRWEKREGMPVHRHVHDKLGTVYAFPSELDEWSRSRRLPAQGAEPAPAEPAETPRRRRVLGIVLGVALAAFLVLAVLNFPRRPENPLANARFVRLTDFEGTEQAAVISRDGRFVAFLSDRDGPVDVWVTQTGTGRFQNLTGGKLSELVNPDIRVLGFSPDGTLVTFWVRRPGKSGPPDISIWSVPTLGGAPKVYLEGTAEFDWSSDGRRLVYHTPAPGDPMFLRDESGERRLFVAPAGVHNHYQVWSPGDEYIYFVQGPVPVEQDIWRVRPGGGTPERMTSHNTRVSHLTFTDAGTGLYLATEADGSGPWLYALDVARRESRRISFGVERYASLAGNADGTRLVATVANPKRTLWRVPISDAVAEGAAATRVVVPIVGGRSPRLGPDFLLYVSSRGDAESIWKLAGGTASELWSVAGGRVIGGPAISRDGSRIAFTAEERGKMRMYVMNADGTGVRAMPDSLMPRSAPAWAPDGASVVLAAMQAGTQRLVKVAIADQSVTPLGSEFAADPVWTADGKAIVYSGPEIGTTFPLKAVTSDGRAHPSPGITLSRGIRRLAFLPNENAVVVLHGEMIHKNFWAVDLATGRERRLTNFGPDFVIADFDVSPDGREIVFDREQDSSDVVLIER
jgi:Tol biopolymer transport system component